MTTGEKIKLLRKELNLTQSNLAGKEMTKSMLSQIENNNAMPSIKNLKYLADKLEKPISYFLDEDSLNKELPIKEIRSKLKIADEYEKSRESKKVIDILDSILNDYDINTDSKLYADILYKNGSNQINLMNFTLSGNYLEKSVEIYKKLNLYSYAAKAHMEFLRHFWNKQDYNKCLKVLDEAYDIYIYSTTEDITFKLEYYFYKTLILSSTGDFHDSFKFVDEAIELSKSTNVYYNSAELYRLKGNLNREIEDYDNVLYYFDKAKLFSKFTDNEFSLALLELNYAVYYIDINKPLKALEYLKTLEKKYSTYLNNFNHLLYNIYSITYYKLEDYEKAYNYIIKNEYPDLNLHHKVDYVNMWLGKVYEGMILYKLGDKNKSIESITKGIEMMSKRGNSKYLSFAYKELSNIHSEMNDYEKAFKTLKKSEEITKELNGKPF